MENIMTFVTGQLTRIQLTLHQYLVTQQGLNHEAAIATALKWLSARRPSF